MFVLKSTHDAALNAVRARDAEIRELSEVNYALDRTAAKYKAERDALRAQLARLTTRGPGGRFVKVEQASFPISGSVAGGPAHQTIS